MAQGDYFVESVTTSEFAPCDRADFWSEHIADSCCRLVCQFPHGTDFRAGGVVQHTDHHQLVQFWSERADYARTVKQIRRDPVEDPRFIMPLSGELVVRQDDQEARLGPGMGSLIELNQPFELALAAGVRAFIMTVPARDVTSLTPSPRTAAAGVNMSAGLGRVVNTMMSGLYKERRLSGTQFDAVCDRMVELLCMLIVGDDRPHVPGHLAEVEAVVRRYVREHAAEFDLTGGKVAAAMGWSVRQIQLALQQAGTTPRELIKEERLRLVRDRLRNPAYRRLSITQLAHDAGFSSMSVLSKAFRKRYGMSPREMRHEADRPPDA